MPAAQPQSRAAVLGEAPGQVSLTRRYRVPPEKVWRAWTEAQALSQWFGHPGEDRAPTVAEIDLSVGGRYRIAFEGANGEMNEVSGVYQEVELHSRLVFTWAWQSTPERVSRVSVTLAAVDGGAGTEMHFVHDRFFDAQAATNHERGWQPAFEALGAFLQRKPQEA